MSLFLKEIWRHEWERGKGWKLTVVGFYLPFEKFFLIFVNYRNFITNLSDFWSATLIYTFRQFYASNRSKSIFNRNNMMLFTYLTINMLKTYSWNNLRKYFHLNSSRKHDFSVWRDCFSHTWLQTLTTLIDGNSPII